MTTKMQSCIDHIKTSTDVDPWAMEMVEQIFTEYDKRFDKALEIIGEEIKFQEELRAQDLDAPNYLEAEWRKHALDGMRIIRDAVLELKGGEQE